MYDKLEVLIEPVYEDGELLNVRLIIFEVENDSRQIRDIGECSINTSSDDHWMKSTLNAAQAFNSMEICTNGLNLPVEIHENHKDVDLGKAQTLQTKLLKIVRSIPKLSDDYHVYQAAQVEAANEMAEAAKMLALCDRFMNRFHVQHEQLRWVAENCGQTDEEIARGETPLAFIAHKGDCICFGDPNHSEGDLEAFKLIAELANAIPQIRGILGKAVA